MQYRVTSTALAPSSESSELMGMYACGTMHLSGLCRNFPAAAAVPPVQVDVLSPLPVTTPANPNVTAGFSGACGVRGGGVAALALLGHLHCWGTCPWATVSARCLLVVSTAVAAATTC
jgi:hypothetical protein